MSWDNQTPSSASWTRPDERTQSMDKGLYFLLKELGDYILQENGYKILLQETWNYQKPITWAKDSLSSASFTNQPQMVAVWS